MNQGSGTTDQPAWSWADRVHILQWARPDWVWWLAFLVVAAMYLSRLDNWLINDDEGSYLYAAWRISLGEVPYRDFLTPQLPAFLYPGALLMKLVGPSAWHARLLAAVLTLGTGIWTWLAARRLFGGWVAVVAGLATLLHPALLTDYRTFRPDPFMLFFATLGVLLFVRAVYPRVGATDPPDRRWLVMSGLVLGLATLSKLFAPLVAAGCMAWLLVEAWRLRRPLSAVVLDALAFVVPAVMVVSLTGVAFVVAIPGVMDAVLGHHLRQGSGQGLLSTIGKGLRLYTEFLRYDNNALLVSVATVVAITAAAARDRRAMIFAWQLPTALAFLLLSRQLFVRHLVYLIPAMSVLFGVAVVWLSHEVRDRIAPRRDEQGVWRAVFGDRSMWLAGAMIAALLVPWLINNWHRSWETEYGTVRAGDLIELLAEPNALVLSDYSELNFYGQRPTTYSGASFSEGAAKSGQISWNLPESPHRIKDELEHELGGELPPLLVLDSSEDFAHLRFLRDYDDFAAWVADNYEQLGVTHRHHQLYDVMVPIGAAPFVARYENGLQMLSSGHDKTELAQGDEVAVRTSWLADGPTDAPAALSLRLVDEGGREWAQQDGHLQASDVSGTKLRTSEEWAAGEVVGDRIVMAIPPGTPPGTYSVVAAMYAVFDDGSQPAGQSFRALDALDADGTTQGRRLKLGQLLVRSGDASTRDVPELSMVVEDDGERFGALRLLGANADADQEQEAGKPFQLELWWQTTGSIDEDLSARVTLHDPNTGALAADWTEPLGAHLNGSSTWPTDGVLARQKVTVPVLADAATGEYSLGVTPVRADGSPYGDGDGATGAPVVLGAIFVEARDLGDVVTDPPSVGRQLDATLGGLSELYGATIDAGSGSAGPWDVELVWRALSAVPVGYRVTVQLLDDEGQIVAQHDGEPANWERPTTGWIPGEVVVDAHQIPAVGELAPGTYRLVAGMYHPLTFERLPATGADSVDDLVTLATFEIP